MPNSIQIKRCVRKEPTTREDYLLRKLKKQGLLVDTEKPVYNLPKAPGVFSLGPDYSPVQVPNDAVTQPVEELDITSLNSVRDSMKDLF